MAVVSTQMEASTVSATLGSFLPKTARVASVSQTRLIALIYIRRLEFIIHSVEFFLTFHSIKLQKCQLHLRTIYSLSTHPDGFTMVHLQRTKVRLRLLTRFSQEVLGIVCTLNFNYIFNNNVVFNYLDTLDTRCTNMISPLLPGYLPTILAAVRSNSTAPASVQTACTNISFPVPRGPTNSTERTSGDNW